MWIQNTKSNYMLSTRDTLKAQQWVRLEIQRGTNAEGRAGYKMENSEGSLGVDELTQHGVPPQMQRR